MDSVSTPTRIRPKVVTKPDDIDISFAAPKADIVMPVLVVLTRPCKTPANRASIATAEEADESIVSCVLPGVSISNEPVNSPPASGRKSPTTDAFQEEPSYEFMVPIVVLYHCWPITGLLIPVPTTPISAASIGLPGLVILSGHAKFSSKRSWFSSTPLPQFKLP